MKWSITKRLVRAIVDAFEWGDYEYLRMEFGKWPFKFWVTVYEPDARGSWHRRIFPWRLRTALASLFWNATYKTCTRCDKGFTLRELLKKDGSLKYFPSGSICHRDCEPSEFFKQTIARLNASNLAVAKEGGKNE